MNGTEELNQIEQLWRGFAPEWMLPLKLDLLIGAILFVVIFGVCFIYLSSKVLIPSRNSGTEKIAWISIWSVWVIWCFYAIITPPGGTSGKFVNLVFKVGVPVIALLGLVGLFIIKKIFDKVLDIAFKRYLPIEEPQRGVKIGRDTRLRQYWKKEFLDDLSGQISSKIQEYVAGEVHEKSSLTKSDVSQIVRSYMDESVSKIQAIVKADSQISSDGAELANIRHLLVRLNERLEAVEKGLEKSEPGEEPVESKVSAKLQMGTVWRNKKTKKQVFTVGYANRFSVGGLYKNRKKAKFGRDVFFRDFEEVIDTED